MILKKIELEKFDIHKFYEYTHPMFFAEVDYDGSSYDFMGRNYPEDEILELLSEGQGLYYSFASRDGNNLECANGKTYLIKEKDSTVGVNMGEGHINYGECITLGYLVYCSNGILTFRAAIEGQASMFSRCVEIDDCGDLEEDLRLFIDQFVI